MSIRVGINGMGRVGRSFLRRAAQSDDLDVVAVNDVAEASTLRNLLRRDSTFGRYDGKVELDGDYLLVNGHKIAVSAIREPDQLPWAREDVDVVVECTGKFRTREAAAGHLRAGAKRVVISAPGKGVDATIVMGVNDGLYDPDAHSIVSNASCTTNCVAADRRLRWPPVGLQDVGRHAAPRAGRPFRGG